jgi:UDP-N-acetylglucosamine 2-epimerase (non-hydrolysing)
MATNLKIMLVAGARPNFMKIAPLISAIKKFNKSINETRDLQLATCNFSSVNYILVHTGQHYDVGMSETFFSELELPEPDINLEVGSASHAVQTANIMIRFEEVCLKEKPDWIIVVGDVNSTMACALVASKIQYDSRQHSSTAGPQHFGTASLQHPSAASPQHFKGLRPLIAHVEAGLRSFDRTMPEEINRVVTDALSDLLFTPSEDADQNLLREGIPKGKIKRVGNIMIDTLVANLDQARECRTWEKFSVAPKGYVFVTLHRPPNVDDKVAISSIFENLSKLSKRIPVVFPMHPRTRKQLDTFGLKQELESVKGLRLSDPIGYRDTICLVENSRFVLTDSGGIQEETTFLGIPCLTLRPNTERPITIKQGTNKLTSLEKMEGDFDHVLNGGQPKGRIPELWDGKTAQRIIEILTKI